MSRFETLKLLGLILIGALGVAAQADDSKDGPKAAIPIPGYVRGAPKEMDGLLPPAGDLVCNGVRIGPDQATQLIKEKKDISFCDALPDDFWNESGKSPYPTPLYPEDTATVTFNKTTPSLPYQIRASVDAILPDGSTGTFFVYFSLRSHAALLRNAMLRALGYTVEAPKHFRNLKIKFADPKEAQGLIDQIKDGTITMENRFVVSKSGDGIVITFQDVILEPGRAGVPQFHWGGVSEDMVGQLRTLRGLIVPLILGNISESVNEYSWEVGKEFDNHILLTEAYADSFGTTTWEDARWILRRLGRFTRADFKNFVAQAALPPPVAELVLEKLIARRNNLMTLFRMGEFQPLSYNLKISNVDVKDGKLMKQKYDSYATLFTREDPAAPLTPGQLARFAKLEGMGIGLGRLISEINSKLPMTTIQDVVNGHNQDLFASFIKSIQNKTPFTVPLKAWGGLYQDYGFTASRNLVSGSYYGVDSRVQLVDSVGARVMLGYFGGIQGGPPHLNPGFHANVSYQRTYVHVRPVASIKAADKASWGDLLVPRFMSNLAAAIAPTDDLKKMNKQLQDFINKLETDELFSVIDTVTLDGGANAAVPIFALLNITSTTGPSMNISVDKNFVVLRRITFKKTQDGGIQVYTPVTTAHADTIAFDFNWYINVFHAQATHKYGQMHTKMYNVPWDEKDEKSVHNAVMAMRGVLRNQSTELLNENYPPYEIDHDLDATYHRSSILFRHWDKMRDTNIVTVTLPKDKAYDNKANVRTFARARIVSRAGNNWFTLFSNVINHFTKGWGPANDQANQNPSNSFFGNAHWASLRTEGELTPDRDLNPVTYLDEIWAGWLLTPKGLNSLLDKIEAKIVPVAGHPIVNRNVFNDMKHLELYEIHSTLYVYEKGMQRIKDAVMDKSKTDMQVYQDLVAKLGPDRLKKYCDFMGMSPGTKTLRAYSRHTKEQNVYIECALPWMRELLDLRYKVHPSSRLDQLKFTTHIVEALLRDKDFGIDFQTFLNWVGSDQYFYLVKVNGFQTHSEDGDTPYLSNTVGTYNSDRGQGIFAKIQNDQKIWGYEMDAQEFAGDLQ